MVAIHPLPQAFAAAAPECRLSQPLTLGYTVHATDWLAHKPAENQPIQQLVLLRAHTINRRFHNTADSPDKAIGVSAPNLAVGRGAGVQTSQNQPSRAPPAEYKALASGGFCRPQRSLTEKNWTQCE